jgi:hypothetical protein
VKELLPFGNNSSLQMFQAHSKRHFQKNRILYPSNIILQNHNPKFYIRMYFNFAEEFDYCRKIQECNVVFTLLWNYFSDQKESLLLLLLLLLSLLSPSCRVFAIIYLQLTMFLEYIVLQLFCFYNLCYLQCYFARQICFVLLH